MGDLTPQAFAEKWSRMALSERSSYQQHFIDLCRMLGQPTPADIDPGGDFYTFEKGVEKSGGGKGFADVWRKGFFAFEYKGRHKDLTAAYSQLLLYREDLENPPLLVVTDTDRFEVHTNFTGTVKKVYAFANAELPREENLAVLRALFEDPGSLRPGRTVEGVTEEAARRFAILADGLRSRGHDPHVAARFLNRLLFCLFAEDIGLLPRDLFTRVAERTGSDPGRFARYAGELFGVMASGGDFLLEDIPRFDGVLEEAAESLPLGAEELRVLVEAARLDWDSVEPAIFGTLFERSLDPAQRAKLGAHYTSREDILAVVEPVLMAPLRREWEEVKGRAGAEAKKAQALSGQKASNALQRAEELLYGFAQRLRRVKVLDPACGSGNFLTVSLKHLEVDGSYSPAEETAGQAKWADDVCHPAGFHGANSPAEYPNNTENVASRCHRINTEQTFKIGGDNVSVLGSEITNRRADGDERNAGTCIYLGQPDEAVNTVVSKNVIHACGEWNSSAHQNPTWDGEKPWENHEHCLYANGARDVRITDNVCYDSADRGWQMFDADGAGVSANLVAGTGTSANVSNSSRDVSFTGNVFAFPRGGTNLYALNITTGGNNTASGNCAYRYGGGSGMNPSGSFLAITNTTTADPRFPLASLDENATDEVAEHIDSFVQKDIPLSELKVNDAACAAAYSGTYAGRGT